MAARQGVGDSVGMAAIPSPEPPRADVDALTRAEARLRAIPQALLRRRSTVRREPGIYAPPGHEITAWDVVAALARAIPGSAINGLSAARHHGFRLPRHLQEDETPHLNTPPLRSPVRRRGLHNTQYAYAASDLTRTPEGLAVTTPERTLYEMSLRLGHEDLVAAGDGILNTHADGYDAGRPPLCTPEDLRRYVRAHRGARGIRAFDRAVARMRPGSDSRPETFLRLACEDHGIDGLIPGFAVRNTRGMLLFQADLALPRLRLSIQYEGAHHDRPEQVRRDVERARRTAEAGWIEVRITAADLREAVWCAGSRMPRAVAIILRAIRDHDAAATPNDAESSLPTENRRISGRK